MDAVMVKNFAFVVGNGETRRGFDIALLYPHGKIYGCGMAFTEYEGLDIIHKTVTVEPYRLEMMHQLGYNMSRVVFPKNETEEYEPIACWRDYLTDLAFSGQTPRMNAGSYAVCEAMRDGADTIYMLGFDFIIEGPECESNIFSGKPEKRCSFEDSKRRIIFMDWLFRTNPDTDFVFVVRDRDSSIRRFPTAKNMSVTHYDELGRDIRYRKKHGKGK